ncbi:MAG: hypothetical protein IK137_04530 [Bacilli bacterium]|nr:hypothetical protein [Bacilli bacterium]
MEKRSKKHIKRARRMILACLLTAILLGVGTYAWFIGMKTVNVSSFDVQIAAIDGLSLSLDGVTWADTVTINQGNYATVNESNNTNSWGGTGLYPMSSVGIIDTTSSRLIMYEKGSFTTTPGGYRVMASQVTNTVEGNTEQSGYVAFDLFIKNLSGHEYYAEQNVLNEEAIYLTPDSKVTAATNGGVVGTGIENSVRVGFAQIGRVIATTTTQATITGITCATGNGVTGICSSRPAQIWEPNDRNHVENAITWYATSCKKRIGADLTQDASYNGTCKTLTDGAYVQTNAISGVINYSDRVDVYDGPDYNSYTGSIAATPTTGKLYAYDYFTDTEKSLRGVERPTFITLAPNSITKVRVYIWIEGQDVDNYDFASLGRKISVAFGLTKERFFDDDVNYQSVTGDNLPTDVQKEEHPSYDYDAAHADQTPSSNNNGGEEQNNGGGE